MVYIQDYLQETIEHSLIFPATNVTESGRLISPPYRFFCLPPTSLLFGFICQKGGFKYFVEKEFLYSNAAKKFIYTHNKHNLWDEVGVIDSHDQRSDYKYRKAMIYVKSRSGHDKQAYHITYDNLSRNDDEINDIIKSLTTQNIVHQCDEINVANTYKVPQKLVDKWLKDIRISSLKIFYLCPHIMNGLIFLANNSRLPYAVDFQGILKEKKLEEAIGPQLKLFNEGISRIRDLNREMSPKIFDDTGLNELINKKLFKIWAEETQS